MKQTNQVPKCRRRVLKVKKYEIAPLVDSRLPAKTRHAIMDAFLGWFVGLDVPTLNDPMANCYLHMLISHQENRDKYREIDSYMAFQGEQQ